MASKNPGEEDEEGAVGFLYRAMRKLTFRTLNYVQSTKEVCAHILNQGLFYLIA